MSLNLSYDPYTSDFIPIIQSYTIYEDEDSEGRDKDEDRDEED